MIWAWRSRSPTICSTSTAIPPITGKPVQQDAAAGKATFVSILGVDRAREQARLLADQAARHLEIFDERADLLKAVATYVVERRH